MKARASLMAERLCSGVAGRDERPDLGASRWRRAWRGWKVIHHGAGGEGALKMTQSNMGMHPTADTAPVKFLRGAARRVMPGVRLLLVYV